MNLVIEIAKLLSWSYCRYLLSHSLPVLVLLVVSFIGPSQSLAIEDTAKPALSIVDLPSHLLAKFIEPAVNQFPDKIQAAKESLVGWSLKAVMCAKWCVYSMRIRYAANHGELRIKSGRPATEFVFKYVPPGNAQIGLTDEQRIDLARQHGNALMGHNARPRFDVEFVEGFFLLDREITKGQYAALISPDEELSDVEAVTPRASVSWRDAYLFCDRLRRQTGFDVRLPSECEWEYACRGPNGEMFARGNTPPKPYREPNSKDYSAVVEGALGGKPLPLTNARLQDGSWRGIHDLSGNLSEWCIDKYVLRLRNTLGEDAELISGQVRVDLADMGSRGSSRAFRGANYSDDSLEAAAALRRSLKETAENDRIGFRPLITVRVPFPQNQAKRVERDKKEPK